MIDYKGLEAIAAVIESQSFHAAADRLFITQSAVTQRIQQIEAYFGQPLLIRSIPYQATEFGEKLLGLLRQTHLLEQHILHECTSLYKRPEIKIALNRDSLETWYMRALEELPILKETHCEVITDDQDVTIDYFKQGLVNASLSTQQKPLPGCYADLLGTMTYRLVASPEFIDNHFKLLDINGLLTAPVLIFDAKDAVHQRYLEHYFAVLHPEFNSLTMPSTQGFKKCAVLGFGYGLIPEIDIVDELKSGLLVDLFPDKPWNMELYWHYWQIQTDYYKQFNQDVIEFARATLL